MRSHQKLCFVLLAACIASSLFAQKWASAYERGLSLAQKGKWIEARKQFLDAIKNRGEDTEKPSTTGGGVADRRPWREGSPYTPNFAAAYCSYKAATMATDAAEQKRLFQEAIQGFSAQIEAGKVSMEGLVFLASSQTAIGDSQGASATQAKIQSLNTKTAFKIDQDVITEDDRLSFQAVAQPAVPPNTTPISNPNAISTLPQPGSDFGLVPPLDFKYALLIGNQAGSGQMFAHGDVDSLKDSLVKDAGYPEANVVVLKDATVEQINQAVNDLAAKMPDNGVLFLFFSGSVAFDAATGKDYLQGVDTPTELSFDKMVPKMAMFQPFVRKGAAVFSFFQCDRRIIDGKYFGLEIPQVGKIAQTYATIPGEFAQGLSFDGQFRGVFTAAMTTVLKHLRSNRIGILDFCWEVFDVCRQGLGGVGGAQTPSLPITTGITGSAKF